MSVWRGNPPPERRTKAVAEERSIFLGQNPQFRILCQERAFRKVRTVQKYKILQRCKRLKECLKSFLNAQRYSDGGESCKIDTHGHCKFSGATEKDGRPPIDNGLLIDTFLRVCSSKMINVFGIDATLSRSEGGMRRAPGARRMRGNAIHK